MTSISKFGALLDVRGDRLPEALVEPALDLLDEPRVLVLARRAVVARHVVGLGVERHLALLRDRERVGEGLGVPVAPQVPHLLGRLDVVAVAAEREALAALVVRGLVERGTGLDAQQRLVRLGVVLGR